MGFWILIHIYINHYIYQDYFLMLLRESQLEVPSLVQNNQLGWSKVMVTVAVHKGESLYLVFVG